MSLYRFIIMNINFSGAFQSLHAKPHGGAAKPFAQAVGVIASKHQIASPVGSIRDEYIPSAPIAAKPHVSFKSSSFLADAFKRPVAHQSAPVVDAPPKVDDSPKVNDVPKAGDVPKADGLAMETEFNPTFEQPAEMNRVLLAIAQIFADNLKVN